MSEARRARVLLETEKNQVDAAPSWEMPDYQPARKLEGKRALVTAGDAGIGRAVAWLFAREGADVAITHLPEQHEDAQLIVARIEQLGRRAPAFEVDLRDQDQARATVDRAAEALGGLDILVNNAAFQRHRMSTDEFEAHIQACYIVAKAAISYLPKGGLIINTGSLTGFEREQLLRDDAVIEGPVQAFSKSLARELVPHGVRVNCVALGPMSAPGEIAPAYVFFASATDSKNITGDVLMHLGGSLASESMVALNV